MSGDLRGYSMGSNLAFRTYLVGDSPKGNFTNFLAWSDNPPQGLNQFVISKHHPYQSWNASYCVDLRLSVPLSVSPGDYYNTVSWELFTSTATHGHATPTPSPTPIPTATPTPPPYVYTAGSWFSGSVSSIQVFDANANGNVAPLYSISSLDPTNYMVNPEHMRVGSDGNLYVGDYATYDLLHSGVFVFPSNAQGSVAPLRYIDGPSTGIQTVQSLALDAANDLYILTNTASGVSISRFAPGANGDVTPVAQFTTGAGTSLWAPNGIAALPDGTLYVVNEVASLSSSGAGNVVAFSPGASGNTTPIVTIAGSNTQIGYPYGIDLDDQGNIYVLTGDNENAASAFPSQGSDTPDVNPRICVYKAGSNGDVVPIAIIEGPATLLESPVAIRVAPDGGIYVAEHYSGYPGGTTAAAVYYYAPGSNGNVAPTRIISGSNTTFDTYGIQGLGL